MEQRRRSLGFLTTGSLRRLFVLVQGNSKEIDLIPLSNLIPSCHVPIRPADVRGALRDAL